MQRALDLRTKLLHLIYILELNSEVIAKLIQGAKRLGGIHDTQLKALPKDELSGHIASLSRFQSSLVCHKGRAETLLRYMEGTTSLVCACPFSAWLFGS